MGNACPIERHIDQARAQAPVYAVLLGLVVNRAEDMHERKKRAEHQYRDFRLYCLHLYSLADR